VFTRHATPKADLWSVGVILFQLLNGVPPITAKTPDELIAKLARCERINFSPAYSASCTHLLRWLLQYDPTHRISWENFFLHPWLGFRDVSPLLPPTNSAAALSPALPAIEHELVISTPKDDDGGETPPSVAKVPKQQTQQTQRPPLVKKPATKPRIIAPRPRPIATTTTTTTATATATAAKPAVPAPTPAPILVPSPQSPQLVMLSPTPTLSTPASPLPTLSPNAPTGADSIQLVRERESPATSVAPPASGLEAASRARAIPTGPTTTATAAAAAATSALVAAPSPAKAAPSAEELEAARQRMARVIAQSNIRVNMLANLGSFGDIQVQLGNYPVAYALYVHILEQLREVYLQELAISDDARILSHTDIVVQCMLNCDSLSLSLSVCVCVCVSLIVSSMVDHTRLKTLFERFLRSAHFSAKQYGATMPVINAFAIIFAQALDLAKEAGMCEARSDLPKSEQLYQHALHMLEYLRGCTSNAQDDRMLFDSMLLEFTVRASATCIDGCEWLLCSTKPIGCSIRYRTRQGRGAVCWLRRFELVDQHELHRNLSLYVHKYCLCDTLSLTLSWSLSLAVAIRVMK
jgi:hypothetical protein